MICLQTAFHFSRPSSLWAGVAVVLLARGQIASADEGAVFFAEKIQPILQERCFDCHSHAAGKTKGGLALDSRSGWSEGGGSGPAVTPGKPEQSLLVKAVRREDPDTAMPPKKPLPAAEVALLTEWVAKGAPDPRVAATVPRPTNDWWSLKPLRKAGDFRALLGAEPSVDAFVQRKLRERGLAMNPAADRPTLIRRVYFDLHGLAPEPEEVSAFCKDPDPAAYEKLVDRLLASPRYGERWARHWLDTIHFADTHGFEHDEIRSNAWRYRDYVIAALNADTPWPRFIREQLAADVFFPDQPQLTAALGFLGAGPFDLSAAGTAPKMFEAVDRDDMLVQTMAAFTSTTAGCARCHDHKFDPISQRDYYALAAVFAGVTKGDLSFEENPERRKLREEWEQLAAAAAKKDPAVLQDPKAQQIAAEWERGMAAPPRWEIARLKEAISAGGATLELREDGSLISSGTRPDKETLTLRSTPATAKIAALRLEVLANPALPKGGPGRQDNGNLHLNECEIYVDAAGGASPLRVPILRASADFNQQDWTIAHAIDGNESTAWGIYPRVGEMHVAVFTFREPVELASGASLRVVLKQVHGAGHIIGHLRLSVTDSASADASAISAALAEALALPPSQRSEAARIEIAAHAVAARAAEKLAALPPSARVYAAGSTVMRKDAKVSIAQPSIIHVLSRGELSQPGEVAAPGALECMSGLNARFDLPAAHPEGARRAALAEWISAEQNGLTWRSIANRVWHYHFGRGLCDTPNDLGRMGSLPSHPELLEWLAADFRDTGGSLKRLHRMIVTSATYRQSSVEDNAEAKKLDADNRWLWRANRVRLDAESFRDIAMQKAGQLDFTMGGPPVMHFKLGPPVQNTPTLDYSAFHWEQPGVNRRSIYRLVFRNIADPFMVALDFPDAAQLAPTRPFSASALQALALWNDDFVLHQSQQLAARLEKAAGPTERIRAATQRLLFRDPDSEEARQFATYAEKHGLAALCRVLFNSSEFLFVN